MTCIYVTGTNESCNMFSEGQPSNPTGCDKEGGCRVSEDPNPSRGCDTYEGVEVCIDCGADENIDGEECEC